MVASKSDGSGSSKASGSGSSDGGSAEVGSVADGFITDDDSLGNARMALDLNWLWANVNQGKYDGTYADTGEGTGYGY